MRSVKEQPEARGGRRSEAERVRSRNLNEFAIDSYTTIRTSSITKLRLLLYLVIISSLIYSFDI